MCNIIYISKHTKLEHLFQLVEIETGSHGGDGSGLVYADNHIELANLYDEWRKDESGMRKLGKDWVREDFKNDVVFSDQSNESITFTNNPYQWRDWHEFKFILVD